MQKDVKLGITKEKLVDATFALMEEADDPLNVTSRQIAERAGTSRQQAKAQSHPVFRLRLNGILPSIDAIEPSTMSQQPSDKQHEHCATYQAFPTLLRTYVRRHLMVAVLPFGSQHPDAICTGVVCP